MKVCPVCGQDYNPGYGWQKYCSPDCRKVAQLRQQRDWWRAHYEPKLPEVVNCPSCGAEFKPQSSNHQYCSTCAEERSKEKGRELTRRYRAEGREDRSGWKPLSKEVKREAYVFARKMINNGKSGRKQI